MSISDDSSGVGHIHTIDGRHLDMVIGAFCAKKENGWRQEGGRKTKV